MSGTHRIVDDYRHALARDFARFNPLDRRVSHPWEEPHRLWYVPLRLERERPDPPDGHAPGGDVAFARPEEEASPPLPPKGPVSLPDLMQEWPPFRDRHRPARIIAVAGAGWGKTQMLRHTSWLGGVDRCHGFLPVYVRLKDLWIWWLAHQDSILDAYVFAQCLAPATGRASEVDDVDGAFGATGTRRALALLLDGLEEVVPRASGISATNASPGSRAAASRGRAPWW